MTSIVKSEGTLLWPDMGKFLRAIEPAEFLFGPDVATYLREMQGLLAALSERQQASTTQNSSGEDVIAASTERTAIQEALGSLNERRNAVFSPYLLIHEE